MPNRTLKHLHWMATTFTGLALTTVTLSAAQNRVYDITFYDTAHNVVGSGTFRVDRANGRCIETDAPDECAPAIRSRGLGRSKQVTAALQSFDANINGRIWHEQTPNTAWWGDTGQEAGRKFEHHGIVYGTQPAWFFGDIDTGTRTLRLTIERATNGNGRGTWVQSIVVSSTLPPERLEGSWTAKPSNNN